MNTPYHHCPACHQDVNFIMDERCKRCPVCYAEFPLARATAHGTSASAPIGQRIMHAIGVLLLVLLGVPALLLAVAFIGCVAMH